MNSPVTNVAVPQACEALWGCQDAAQAVEWLQVLHTAILRKHRLEAMDPAEIFLALQGAALRFRSRDEEPDEDTDDILMQVQEKSLWAAAALARLSIGPAWWSQRQRREQLRTAARNLDDSHSTQLQYPIQHAADSNHSWSTLTALDRTWYQPHIAEVLPAAMIRFAASIMDNANTADSSRERSLAQAQIVLLLAMGCPPDNNNVSSGWVIPGVQDAVESMVLWWLSLAMEEYWAFTLQVTETCSDLIAAGWHPTTTSSGRMVDSLLVIACDATSSRGIDEENSTPEARKERMEACASAAKAVSALASLGSQGLIPHKSLRMVVMTLCQLHVLVDSQNSQISRAFPVPQLRSVEEEDEVAEQLASFQTYRQTCFKDISLLLWFLLAQEASAEASMETLLSLVHAADPTRSTCSLPTDLRDWSGECTMACAEAAAAIRVLSSALWGNPPEIVSIPLLRVFWNPVLETIRQLLTSFYATIVSNDTIGLDELGGCTTLEEETENPTGVTKKTQWYGNRKASRDLSALSSEALMSLGRMIGKEIRGGIGILSGVEWDAFIACLDEAILPWLSWSHRDEESAIAMRSALLSFFSVLRDFLGKCVRFDSTPLIEYSNQKRMFMMLLQRAVPFLEVDHSVLLGTEVVRCWLEFGLFPYCLEGWTRTASDLLEELFRVTDSKGYVYSPSFRLEALKILTRESETGAGSRHPASTTSLDKVPAPSFLTLTQHMREQYLEFINICIIPRLEAVLLYEVTQEKKLVFRASNSMGGSDQDVAIDIDSSEESDFIDQLTKVLDDTVKEPPPSQCDTEALQLFAVKLVGRLYRGVTGHRQHRARFVDLLQSVARNRRHDAASPDGPEKKKLSHSFPVRAAAVIELERCLAAPFPSLPYAHESVPSIIEAMCSVFKDYTRQGVEKGGPSQSFKQATALAILALEPLLRLRIAIDRHVAFRLTDAPCWTTRNVIVSFLSSVMKPNARSRNPVAETYGSPFLVADDTTLDSKTKTKVSIEPIVLSFVSFLRASNASLTEVSSQNVFLLRCIRIACFDMLRTISLGSMSFAVNGLSSGDVFPVNSCPGPLRKAEMVAKGRALAKCSQNIVLRARGNEEAGHGCDSGIIEHVHCMVALILRLCQSSTDEEFIIACRTLSSILPSLSSLQNFGEAGLLDRVCLAVRQRVGVEESRVDLLPAEQFVSENMRSSTALLSLFHDCLVCTMDSALHCDLLLQCFRLCYKIVCKAQEPSENYCLHLALRCIPPIVDRMSLEDVAEAKLILNSTSDLDTKIKDTNFLPMVIPEILENRLHCLQNDSGASDCPEYPMQLSKHELLAMDADNLERFEVDDGSGVPGEPVASWLCREGVVLTCRVGSTKSRYRGWIELVLRTLSRRRRILARLPGRISLADPEFPSSLWSPLPTDTGENEENPTLGVLDLPLVQKKYSNDVMQRAREVMARFDALMPPADRVDLSCLPGNGSAVANHRASPTVAATSEGSTGKDEESLGIAGWVETICDTDKEASVLIQGRIHSLLASTGIKFDGESSESIADTSFRRLKSGPRLDRAMAVLDRTSVLNTHKIGLLYDRSKEPNQTGVDAETTMLTTTRCSPAFHRFLNRLGKVTPTRQLKYFSGGLDVSSYESDGKYAAIWVDDDDSRSMAATNMIVFHVVNLMPEVRMNRKRHVGNDNVLILYSDKGSNALVEFDLAGRDLSKSVIGGAFGFVSIFVTSHRPNALKVALRVRQGLPTALNESLSSFVSDNIVHEDDAPVFVRNLAMRADLACRASVDTIDPPSNCLERYHLLREMQRHIAE